jgi:hypothetical protein
VDPAGRTYQVKRGIPDGCPFLNFLTARNNLYGLIITHRITDLKPSS